MAVVIDDKNFEGDTSCLVEDGAKALHTPSVLVNNDNGYVKLVCVPRRNGAFLACVAADTAITR